LKSKERALQRSGNGMDERLYACCWDQCIVYPLRRFIGGGSKSLFVTCGSMWVHQIRKSPPCASANPPSMLPINPSSYFHPPFSILLSLHSLQGAQTLVSLTLAWSVRLLNLYGKSIIALSHPSKYTQTLALHRHGGGSLTQ
jgi:hypothetical protein